MSRGRTLAWGTDLRYLLEDVHHPASRSSSLIVVDSWTGSSATRRVLERANEMIREESRNVREGMDDVDELLREFRTLRDRAKQPTPGRLIITYEQYVGEFED